MRLSRMIRPRVFVPILGMAAVTVALVGVARANRPAAAPSPEPAAGLTAPRQMLFVDPATGQAREATPAELEQLKQMQADALAATPPTPVVSPVGNMEGLRLSDDQMVFSVATRKPDGSVALQETVGRQATARAVKKGGQPVLKAGQPVLKAGKEMRDER